MIHRSPSFQRRGQRGARRSRRRRSRDRRGQAGSRRGCSEGEADRVEAARIAAEGARIVEQKRNEEEAGLKQRPMPKLPSAPSVISLRLLLARQNRTRPTNCAESKQRAGRRAQSAGRATPNSRKNRQQRERSSKRRARRKEAKRRRTNQRRRARAELAKIERRSARQTTTPKKSRPPFSKSSQEITLTSLSRSATCGLRANAANGRGDLCCWQIKM